MSFCLCEADTRRPELSMMAILPSCCLALLHLCVAFRRGRAVFALVLLFAASLLASAQNTTISGTVYDPRTTSSALPLPHVLVYATTAAVAPLPAGVQCLTYQAPTGVVSFTYTAVDGTFTLAGIPEIASYTVVIQAGKWRRQFPNQAVGSVPLTGLQLHMPADHTQGDIPLIAVATGNLDGSECVLRDMGIADSEYTDDNGTSGGRIHLYIGTDNGYVDTNYGYPGGGGAVINASTPLETALTENATTLAQYDVVMFPCHGYASVRDPDELNNVLNYANAGGRIFTSDFGYQWLDPGAPYNSPFPPVANWNVGEMPYYIYGLVTVNQSFNDGATMAQWLEDAGATITGTTNQVPIENGLVRLDTVIAPTQPWLTLNSNTFAGQNGNPVMQFTFNAPVGAPAANQCGRVMFNDYHVIPASAYRLIFPTECPLNSGVMSPQEQMLEYALFDLSAFVQPVVVPDLNIAFNPSPLRVGSGDMADQLAVTVTNNSATNALDSSATLSFTLPPLLTVTAITDSSGGWTCTVATLSCTRNSQLAVGASDSVTLDINVTPFVTAPSPGQLTATVSDVAFSSSPSASDTVVYQSPPVITWPAPKAIAYGTPLSGTQLDATANTAGSFVYSPAAGTVLSVGQHTLTAIFTPTDTVDYSTATVTVTLTVFPGAVTVTLTSSANPIFLSNPVTLTASLPSFASSETGSMTFYSGSTALGTATISGGSATLTTTSIAAGLQSITAVYSGDANVNPATSNAISETVQDFTLTVSGPSGVNVRGGGTATYTLIVTPVGGTTLPAAVSLSASEIPLDATATFSPGTVAANSAATSVTLELKMPGSAASSGGAGCLAIEVFPWPWGCFCCPLPGGGAGGAGAGAYWRCWPFPRRFFRRA